MVDLHLSILEVSLIVRVVGQSQFTLALHVVLVEYTFIDLTRLSEIILSFTVEFSINEITLVHVTIEFKFSFAGFLAIYKVSGINNLVVVPLLSSLAVIGVVLPLTLVHGALLVDEYTFAASFALEPLSLVDVSVRVCHSSLAMEQRILCHSLVPGAVWEFHDSHARPHRVLLLVTLWDGPLTSVLAALLDVHNSSVPEMTFAATLWLR